MSKEVYGIDGESLGDEYINLEHLQVDSKKAIMHIIYMDEKIDEQQYRINKLSNIKRKVLGE